MIKLTTNLRRGGHNMEHIARIIERVFEQWEAAKDKDLKKDNKENNKQGKGK